MSDRRGRVLLAGVAVAGVALVTACVVAVIHYEPPPPNVLTYGEVVEKSYDDPDDWFIPINTGKSVILIPQHDDAHWWLRVRGVDGSEQLLEWHEVGQMAYEYLGVGDRWGGET